jgi:hypothetical protein
LNCKISSGIFVSKFYDQALQFPLKTYDLTTKI